MELKNDKSMVCKIVDKICKIILTFAKYAYYILGAELVYMGGKYLDVAVTSTNANCTIVCGVSILCGFLLFILAELNRIYWELKNFSKNNNGCKN